MFCSLLGGAVSRALLLSPQDKLARAPASSRTNQLECCKLPYQGKRPLYAVKKCHCRADHLQPHRIGFLLHCPSCQRRAEAWGCSNNPSSPFQRRASKERGDLRQGTMESVASAVSTGRGERRKWRQPGRFVCKFPCSLQGQRRSRNSCPPWEEKCYALGWLLPRNLNQSSTMLGL